MPFLTDFANAIDSYVTDSVTLSVVDVTGPGAAVNVNEVWTFQARVTNNGNLNMTGVVLHIEGKNGAQVSTSNAGPWSSSIVTGSLTVLGGGGSTDTANLYFKAPSSTKPAFTTLVSFHVSNWDANLDRLLKTLTSHDDSKFGHYLSAVVAS